MDVYKYPCKCSLNLEACSDPGEPSEPNSSRLICSNEKGM